MVRKMYSASMDKVYKSKCVDGLRIIDPLVWNKGAYCGLIMKIASTADSIWINWMYAYYLKGKHRLWIFFHIVLRFLETSSSTERL